MLELERLIQKFWADQTNLAENRRLIQLLEQYKEVQKDFRERESHLTHDLQPDKALSLLQRLHKDLGMDDLERKQKAKIISIRKVYRRIAVAASVFIIAGLALLFAGRHKQNQQIVKNTIPELPRIMRLVNSSDSTMPVNLKDGSTVQLEKNSSLSWYEPFINDRRDISLNGIAIFKVAQDKTKPFTVYAGGIATRALGTRFLVNNADVKKVIVQLLEGKVAVNTARGSGLTMRNVYLTPGQEFSFDKNSRQYIVNTITDKPGKTGKPVIPDSRSELVFNKEPLGLVFKQIGNLYKVPVAFRKEDMKGLYFTGTFLKSDGLNIVLSTICNVNDLLFTKEQDNIIITKSH
jgi:transmembrane sensor